MVYLESIFISMILCAGTVYMVFATILLFFKTPNTSVFRPYRVSKMLLASCFFLLGLNMYFSLAMFHDKWFSPEWHILVLNLSVYYVVAKLFSFAFSNLLDKNYLSPFRLKKAAFKAVVIASLLATPICNCMPDPIKYACLGIAGMFFIKFYYDFLVFLYYRFKKMRKDVDNYYSEDKTDHLDWIHRCVLLLVFFGLLASITIIQGVFFNLCFHFVLMFFNLYFVIKFINYRDSFVGVDLAILTDEADDDDDEMQTKASMSPLPQSEYTINLIEEKVNKWLEEKRYRESQFTINEMAQEIGTNKTYLSTFINNKYGVNFCVWITKLRIDEAKRLMIESPDSKLETIALATGFSSSSYFSKAFSKYEELSPVLWRKAHGGGEFLNPKIAQLSEIAS